MENYFLSKNIPSLIYTKRIIERLFFTDIYIQNRFFYIVRNVKHNAWGKGVYTWNSHKNSS